jgi:hypothetical protein
LQASRRKDIYSQNCLTLHMLYKPQHTPVVQWYQYYCARTLAQILLPVTAIRRLPFALNFLTSFLLGFLWPRLITSALGYTCFAWAGGTFFLFPVVLLCQFFVLVGNRLWCYILLTYLGVQ